jgi:nucleotide-binding universal stress UspA family protein
MKILLAVDGSPCSEAAVDEVASRPWPSKSELRIVSAFEIPLSPTPEAWAIPPEYYNEMEQAVKKQAQKVVDATCARLQQALGQSVKVTGQVLQGSPQSAILEEAERWKADLIVVGSHGYGTWHRLVLGSVSQAIVLHAKCSVEVARRNDDNKGVKAA